MGMEYMHMASLEAQWGNEPCADHVLQVLRCSGEAALKSIRDMTLSSGSVQICKAATTHLHTHMPGVSRTRMSCDLCRVA
jgi:hypothetical protein